MYGVGFGYGSAGATTVLSGGDAAYDADAQSYFNANSTLTDVSQKNAINQFYIDLKSYSLFTLFHKFHFKFLGNSTRNGINGKNPANFTHNYSSGFTFSSSGETPNGTSAYVDTNYNFKTNSSINSASFGTYFRTNSTSGSQFYGALGLGNLLIHNNLSNGNFVFGDVSTNILSYTASPTTRLICTVRESSSIHKAYRDGVLLGTNTGVITDFPNLNFYEHARNNNGTSSFFCTHEQTFSFTGEAMTPTQIANLTTCVNTLMTTLGINV
jgi:hypothetical protein